MYFCPCSCNDPFDPEAEENTFVSLPRNLSYVQEGYLDRYSVSARFVHNPKIEQTIQHQQSQERWASVEDETYNLLSTIKAQDLPVRCDWQNHSTGLNAATHLKSTSPENPLTCSKNSTAADTTGNWLLSPSSPFSPSSFFEPASRVASRLSSLLHSPPNESMDFARDAGSSVDGEREEQTPAPEEEMMKDPPQMASPPDGLGEEIDRGGDMDLFSPEYLDSGEGESTTKCETVEKLGEIDCVDNEADSEDNLIRDDELLKSLVSDNTCFPPSDIEPDIGKNDVSGTESGNDPNSFYGSPDSDILSEEGVFVNMDDLDSTTERSIVSETSDDTCVSVDSQFLSPAEGELEEEGDHEPNRKMTIEEAISRAASDLHRMSFEQNDEGDDLNCSSITLTLRTVGRGSPVRSASGLKIKITDQSDPNSQPHFSDSSNVLSESPIYPENEFNFSRVQLRKSSSLKSNKTPPGTPHRKKVVRFADAMGLDLESVRHVLNMESPPKIPASAMADLRHGLNEDRKEIGSKYLCPCFGQPGAADNYVQRVLQQRVCLENAIVTDLTVTGFVRVANIAFHKSVRVRYTHNSWATFHDIAASYVLNSCDGPTDRFSFSIVAPTYFDPGCRLEFAISYNAGGVEYWDSNNGNNYVFECFAKTVPTESETAWLHFL